MTPARTERILRAVEAGVDGWPRIKDVPGVAAPSSAVDDVMRPMPRRAIGHEFDNAPVALPMAHRVTFRPGILYPFLRLLVWMRVCLYFLCGNAIDALMRRDGPEKRAVRLRRLFEGAGGSFGKLAQQLSQRADLLPYAYCTELNKMLDRAPAFPTADAIAIIEQNLDKRLGEVFEIFDPDPIGSTAIACVYQAKLAIRQTSSR